MRAEYSGQLLGVSGLMDDDVANGPGFTPSARIGPSLLHRIEEGLPLGESFCVNFPVDFVSHPVRIPTASVRKMPQFTARRRTDTHPRE